jgi:4-amino-4-deoxy-L-arabinose transferase-like glycosyltransferase
VAIGAVAIAALLYGVGLDVSPIYLTHDEVIYARNALSIAESGRDLSGQLLPISIPVTGTFYATPANIYLTALFLKVLPLSEVSVRLPSVLVGLVCVWLTFVIARNVLRDWRLGAVAAAILLLTPAHFVHSRLGTDHLYLVVCVLAWLAVLTRSGEVSPGRLFLAGASLGASLYTYLGAAITAPACLAITMIWLAATGVRRPRAYLTVFSGFVVLALPFLLWHLTHPGQYLDQMRMYALADGATPGPVPPVEEKEADAAERIAVYWDYFNPSFLFFAGDSGLLNGTRYSGVFLLSMLVLLPVGVIAILAKGRNGLLLLLTLAVAPLAATVVAERYRINRALILLPVAAMIAAAAIEWMWRARQRVWRWAAIALLAVMPLQFAGFYRDYFTDYRVRSAPWFEYNLRGAMEEIMRRPDATNGVWIAQGLNWADYYWPFYLDRHGRRDLAPGTHYFDAAGGDVSAIPAGGYVLCSAHDERRFLDAGFTRIAAVREPDQTHSLSVLQR